MKDEQPVEEGDFLSELMQATKHDHATMEIPDESRYMPERFGKPVSELDTSMLNGHLSYYLKRQQYYEDQLAGRLANIAGQNEIGSPLRDDDDMDDLQMDDDGGHA